MRGFVTGVLGTFLFGTVVWNQPPSVLDPDCDANPGFSCVAADEILEGHITFPNLECSGADVCLLDAEVSGEIFLFSQKRRSNTIKIVELPLEGFDFENHFIIPFRDVFHVEANVRIERSEMIDGEFVFPLGISFLGERDDDVVFVIPPSAFKIKRRLSEEKHQVWEFGFELSGQNEILIDLSRVSAIRFGVPDDASLEAHR